jgi:2-hydroxy-3-keto-5-methylthiopentenyl-1-phosphate phosphatase
MLRGVLLLLDFDGTIVDHDCLATIAEHWAPGVFAETEDLLESGALGLNEVIARQFSTVDATLEDLLLFLRGLDVRVRDGLPELVDFCRARYIDVTVVSSGFEELIHPVLLGEGLDLPVVANHAVFGPGGAEVTFVDRPICDHCGDRCKRVEVTARRHGQAVAYVGDGFSDRCAAQAADLAFARDRLASYLDGLGVPFTPFDDFHDVRRGLAAYLEPSPRGDARTP